MTRGSTRIWRSSIAPIARDTASMSALTKLSVTGVRDFAAGTAGAVCADAGGSRLAPSSVAAAASVDQRRGAEEGRCIMAIRSK